jgi:hypothetical protein
VYTEANLKVSLYEPASKALIPKLELFFV